MSAPSVSDQVLALIEQVQTPEDRAARACELVGAAAAELMLRLGPAAAVESLQYLVALIQRETVKPEGLN